MNQGATFMPAVEPLKKPVEFTPMKGLMSIGQIICDRFGLMELWKGDDGIEGVMRQKLTELGVPKEPISISGPKGMTIRQVAEQSGFIKRPRPQRRVKA